MSRLLRNISNLPGWRSNRKLVIFTVDDYGSIRMSSQESYEALVKAGLNLSSRYNRFDTIESNPDLELLFEVLTKFKDRNGNNPVFSPLVCVANPDFGRIKSSHFNEYLFEPFTETLKRYPEHDRVYDLWKQGIKQKIFMPQFHAREHLNIKRWMFDLKMGVKSTRLAFEYGVVGISQHEASDIKKDYLAAYDIDHPDDLGALKGILSEGLVLFEKLVGYKSSYFTPTNGLFNHKLDDVLNMHEVHLINVGKFDREPMGNGNYKKSFHYLGQRNHLNQRYIVRNALFEPGEPAKFNWIDRCMNDIEIAFRWRKPAIISSHRVNYSGFLIPSNRSKSLKELNALLSSILRKWPDAEFLSINNLRMLMDGSK